MALYFVTNWLVEQLPRRMRDAVLPYLFVGPAMALLPIGFALLLLQGLSEIVKRVGWLMHKVELSLHYERPLQ